MCHPSLPTVPGKRQKNHRDSQTATKSSVQLQATENERVSNDIQSHTTKSDLVKENGESEAIPEEPDMRMRDEVEKLIINETTVKVENETDTEPPQNSSSTTDSDPQNAANSSDQETSAAVNSANQMIDLDEIKRELDENYTNFLDDTDEHLEETFLGFAMDDLNVYDDETTNGCGATKSESQTKQSASSLDKIKLEYNIRTLQVCRHCSLCFGEGMAIDGNFTIVLVQ